MPLRIEKIELNSSEDDLLIEKLEEKFVRPDMDLDGAQTILDLYEYRIYSLEGENAYEVDRLEANKTYCMGSEIRTIGNEGNEVDHKRIEKGFEIITDENGNISEVKIVNENVTYRLAEA